jgi:predicted neuraminidase
MTKTLSAAACIALMAGPMRCDPIPDLADGKFRPSAIQGVQEAYIPIKFPSSHAANLLELPNGDLLCAYFSGTWENESNLAIVVARLPHGSHTWEMPQVAAQKEGWAFQNPVLFQAPGGPLWLMHTSQAAGAGQSEARMFSLTSSDNGKSWSAAKLMFDQPGAFDRQRLVVVGKEWLLPMYFTPSYGITKGAEKNYPVVQISTDHGQQWKSCSIPESGGMVQPDVIQLGPKRFVAFYRSRFADWVYKSESTDGCVWTAPKQTQVPNNNASIQVARLKNGHLVIAFNNTQAATSRGKPRGAARVPVSIALSEDEGKTWPWVRDVETGQEIPQEPVPETITGVKLSEKEMKDFKGHLNAYEYPSILQTSDGLIHAAYSFRRRTVKEVSFHEGWIKGGGTTGVFKGDGAGK